MHSLPKINPPAHFTTESILARAPDPASKPPSPAATAQANDTANRKNADALKTQALLVQAVRLIDKAHAWPTDVSAFQIDIVDGAEFSTTSDPGAVVDPEVSLYEGKNLRIRRC